MNYKYELFDRVLITDLSIISIAPLKLTNNLKIKKKVRHRINYEKQTIDLTAYLKLVTLNKTKKK